jgi:P2-related tail formation protein
MSAGRNPAAPLPHPCGTPAAVKDTVRHMGQQIGFLETYIKGHGR